MKSTLKRTILLGALCGFSVSSVYSMETLSKVWQAIRAIGTAEPSSEEISKTENSEPDFSEILVSDHLMKRMNSCAIKLKHKYEGKKALPHMLIEGPCERKRTFVTKLAQFAGIKCYFVKRFNFSRFSAKKPKDQLIEMFSDAEKQPQPIMIVFDLTDPEHENLKLNNDFTRIFLKYLDVGKTQVVVITDESYHLSAALLRRLGQTIVFEEPDDALKLQMLNHYLDEYLWQPQEGKSVQVEEGALSQEVLTSILAQFPTWTESDICRFVQKLEMAAHLSQDYVLRSTMVTRCIEDEKARISMFEDFTSTWPQKNPLVDSQ